MIVISMMSSDFKTISQKDYLRKYMGKKKKKKVKPTGVRRKNIKIVDDNIDVRRRNDHYDIESVDDAPVVAAIIDEKPRAIRDMELYGRTDRWQSMGVSSEDTRKYETQILSSENNMSPMKIQPSKHRRSHERFTTTHKNHHFKKQTSTDASPSLKRNTCDSRQSFRRKAERTSRTSDNDCHSSRKTKSSPYLHTNQESNQLYLRVDRRSEKCSHDIDKWQYNRHRDDSPSKVHFQHRKEISSSSRRKNRYQGSPNRRNRTVRIDACERLFLEDSCPRKYLEDISSCRNSRYDERTRIHSPVQRNQQVKKCEYRDQFASPKNRLSRRSRDLSLSSPRRYSSNHVRELPSSKPKNERVDISYPEEFSPCKDYSSIHRFSTRRDQIDRWFTRDLSPSLKRKRIEKSTSKEFSSIKERRSNKRRHGDDSSSGRSRTRNRNSSTRKNQQSQRFGRKDYSPRKIHDPEEYPKNRESSMRKQRDEISVHRKRRSDICSEKNKQSKKLIRVEVPHSKSHRLSELWSGDHSPLGETHYFNKHTKSVTPEKRSKVQSKYMFDSRNPRYSSSPPRYRHSHKKDHDVVLSHKGKRQKYSEENSSPKKDYHSTKHENYRLVKKQPLSSSHHLEKHRHNSYHEEISSSENDYRSSRTEEKIHRSVQGQSPPPQDKRPQESNYRKKNSPKNYRSKKYEANYRSMKKKLLIMSPPFGKTQHEVAHCSEVPPNYSKSKLRDMQYKMSNPLARYANGEDLDKMLREQERLDDPKFEYIQKKKRKKEIKEGKVKRPDYQGSFPQNRFGISPGHNSDGVDRSNVCEKKWFAK